MFCRRTLEETKTANPLALRPTLSQPSWTILLTVFKTMRKAIEAIPTEERTKEIVMNSGQDPITRTLGISWNSTKNVFTVTSSAVSPELQTTNRNVLRKVTTNFDPLGFVCPYVIMAKILLQELWMRGYDRDDEVQDEISIGWRNWKVCKRWRFPGVCDVQSLSSRSALIVAFVDASQQAYGAAVYMHYEYDNGTVTSRLIAAICKVASLTPMTVPRLELMGAISGLRLTQSLLMVLEAPMQSVTFYSDRTDFLWWIWGRGKDFRPFVANRIGEIQIFTEQSQWQHVSTVENPANVCTRGASPSELAECSM